MANLNVNIAKKLISYVRHGVDINDEIKQIYNNSLIFIGDEGQIYVPAMNTYVGIGETAYTATIDRIAAVEEQIRKLAETLGTDLVSKIYANYSSRDLVQWGRTGIASASTLDETWALKNDVTIKGVNDYDPTTGFARTPSHPYSITNADGTINTDLTYSALYHNGTKANQTDDDVVVTTALPTSGITVTPHWGAIERDTNPVTGQMVTKRFGNYITIDDSLTWSYMTSAYSYTLNFAQRYTANEVDRLYHNLIGDSHAVYTSIPLGYVVTNITDLFASLSDTDKANYATYNSVIVANNGSTPPTYWSVKTGINLSYATYTTPFETSDKEYHTITAQEIANILSGGSDAALGQYVQYTTDYSDLSVGVFPQLYVVDTQYDSSYNMNIRDGINTLKEVAYLLDLLSDGTLGKTTYVTWGEILTWGATTFTGEGNYTGPAVGANEEFVLSYHDTNDSTNDWERTFHRIYTGGKPNASETYAYWVVEGDAETLGIQIAYSIAGNKTEIDDLHKHTDWIEKGDTTLRSVKTKNSNFVDFKTIGGKVDWTNTDSNQGSAYFDYPGHPNNNAGTGNDEGSYLVGDVKLQVTLNTASTYATSYTASGVENRYFKDEYGVEWFGCYTLADMNNLTADGSYFTMNANQPDANGTYSFTVVPEVKLDPRTQDPNNPYYWIPNAADGLALNNQYQNRTFKKISKADLQAASGNAQIGTTKEGVAITKNNCEMFYYKVTDDNTGEVSYVQIGNATAALATNNTELYFLESYEYVAVHAYIGNNAIATTEWTGALIDAKVGAIADDLEDILAQAKKYTDDKIEALDNQYIYSDFNIYWDKYLDDIQAAITANASAADTEVTFGAVTCTYGEIVAVGSFDYTTAYNALYETFKTNAGTEYTVFGGEPSASNPYRISYATNSQYVYDLIEENGIVNGATHELPTDTFAANVEIWGDESNVKNVKHEYEDVVLPSSGSRKDTLFEKLYKWANTHDDNQVFVKDTTLESYIALDPEGTYDGWTTGLPAGNVVGGTDTKLYIIENGVFIQKVNSSINPVTTFTNYRGATNDKYWRQLYQKGPKYVELNFDDSEESVVNLNAGKNIIVIGEYTLTKSGDKIAVTKNNEPLGNLLCIKGTTTKSVKYFSVDTKHYSYLDNGFGENAVNVTAHITRVEDAAEDNTGFADAYDVQTFVENYFKWIDISATVTDAIVTASDKYHKQVSLQEYLDLNANGSTAYSYEVSAGTYALYLYNKVESNNTVSFNEAQAITIKTFWTDDNSLYVGDQESLGLTYNLNVATSGFTYGVHVPVNGYFLHKEFNVVDNNEYKPDVDNYYIRIESAKINPRNLTETLYK